VGPGVGGRPARVVGGGAAGRKDRSGRPSGRWVVGHVDSVAAGQGSPHEVSGSGRGARGATCRWVWCSTRRCGLL